jgi:hypothetical protein
MLIIFFDIKENVDKELLRLREHVQLRPELCRQETKLAAASKQPIVSYPLFHQGIFDQRNNMTVVSHPPYVSLFKLKGRHFDTTEVIEVESQAVLNILTEHDFQNESRNDRSDGKGAYARTRATSREMVSSTPKVIF